MKKIFILASAMFAFTLAFAKTSVSLDYDTYYTSARMRIDVVLAGDAKNQGAFLDGLSKESIWGGSKVNLVEPFGYGEYKYEVFASDGKLIFSKGFNSLFQEWRTTAEAREMKKAFSMSLWIPYPKAKVNVVISEREKHTGKYSEISKFAIDPADKAINRGVENDYKAVKFVDGGDPSVKVDLVFVAEGYAASDMEKFRKDVAKFTGYLFNMEPYKSRKGDFNIWAVEAVSPESGTDFPHLDVWKRTALNSNFYSLRIDRYLTAPDQKLIAKAVSGVPCDAIYVIVNTEKYGGGGIYNFYGLSMSDHKLEAEVFVHELGHSFAGLGDEYYESTVTYEEFYSLKCEPWEPNLSTLVNFSSKWKKMIEKGTPIPTPNDKAYAEKVGAFEGGGYMSKGLYRPYLDCRMKTNTAKGFCPVCVKAINDMIDIYTK